MTAIETYRFFLDLFKKEVNGNIPPPQFDRMFNRAQMEYMRFLLGAPEENQPGRPIPTNYVNANKKIDNALLPFRETIQIQIDSMGIGVFNPNDDFAYGPLSVSSSGYVNSEDCDPPLPKGVKPRRPIDFVTDGEWDDRTSSTIDFPTHYDPIARTTTETEIEVSPYTIGQVEWVYLRNPEKIYTGRTISQGRYVLDPNDPNNVDPEWGDVDLNAVIIRTVAYAAQNLSNDRMAAFGARKTEGGM